mmetsp:Transcript_43577/g.99169  ORF Transcript_43577/g.99169 Transcript_43577/m.99169 type:complete len:234 (+) Transcript_43577:247-948(+)
MTTLRTSSTLGSRRRRYARRSATRTLYRTCWPTATRPPWFWRMTRSSIRSSPPSSRTTFRCWTRTGGCSSPMLLRRATGGRSVPTSERSARCRRCIAALSPKGRSGAQFSGTEGRQKRWSKPWSHSVSRGTWKSSSISGSTTSRSGSRRPRSSCREASSTPEKKASLEVRSTASAIQTTLPRLLHSRLPSQSARTLHMGGCAPLKTGSRLPLPQKTGRANPGKCKWLQDLMIM